MKDNPKVSIITVVYNGEEFLEETILSVLNQSYENIEYVIIDGGSTDGTVDIIKKYEDKIDYWVSEPDKGIYDAMNKGLDNVTGKWINFMNAGDKFYNSKVLEEVFCERYAINIGIIYGKTDIGNKVLKYKKNLDLKDMSQGMMICHQSTFYKSDKNIRYVLSYKICGDQEYTMQYLKKYKALYIDKIIAIYLLGGISSMSTKIIIQEKKRINELYNFGLWPIYKSFCISILVKIREYILRKLSYEKK